jgi:hypothetical protein
LQVLYPERVLFFIHTSKSKTHKLGISLGLNFFVVQNIRDSYLLASFSQIFGCGYFNIVEKSGIVTSAISSLADITDKIIPFLFFSVFFKSITYKELLPELKILMILKDFYINEI